MNRLQRAVNAFRYEKEVSKKFKIFELPSQRTLPSVDQYLQAMDSASNKIIQGRTLLYDFYNTMLMLDSFVTSLMDKRLENIQNKTIQLEYGGEVVEDLSYFFTAPQFRSFIDDIILTKFWGFNLFEFDKIKQLDKLWFDYTAIPHKHVNPYRMEVLEHQFDSEGTSFANKPDVMFIGSEDDLGAFSQITLLSIYKRLGLFNYSKYVDLASENFTQLKVKGYVDDENIFNVQNQLSERTAGGILNLPEGMDMITENQTSTQQNQLFENYMKMLKEEIAIAIIGQTMTVFDGSSRAQAEVHQEEQSAKFSSDEKYVLDILNYEFVDYLTLWDIKLNPKEIKFSFKPNTAVELRKKLNEYKTLKELGVVFTDQELREIFKEIL